MLSWIFIVLAHWSNSPPIDMSPHSDTLSWFWANQSLLFLLNATCLAGKQQIPILYSLVWPDQCLNPYLPHSRWARWPLGITPLMWYLRHISIVNRLTYSFLLILVNNPHLPQPHLTVLNIFLQDIWTLKENCKILIVKKQTKQQNDITMVSLNLKLNYTKIFISSPGNLYSNNRACHWSLRCIIHLCGLKYLGCVILPFTGEFSKEETTQIKKNGKKNQNIQ